MKTIIRLDTDDEKILEKFIYTFKNNEVVVIPKSNSVEVFIVSDEGKVTKLK